MNHIGLAYVSEIVKRSAAENVISIKAVVRISMKIDNGWVDIFSILTTIKKQQQPTNKEQLLYRI